MNPDTLQAVTLAIAAERSVGRILAQIVDGLAAQPVVVLARVWLVGPGDICATCRFRPECPDQTRCLHLSASAGNPSDGLEDWSRSDGAFKRFPLGVRKIGRIGATGQGISVEDIERDHAWVARPEWVTKEGVRSFGGQPLVFRDDVLGVLGVFSRDMGDRHTFAWLRTFADHAAIAIANARVTEEIEQLRDELTEAQRLSSTGSFTWRVSTDAITWSDQSYRIFQLDRGTPVTLGLVVSRVHPEDASALQEVLMLARQDGRDVAFDVRLRLPDTSVRYVHVLAHSSRDKDGVLKYTGAFQDVTDRQRSEDALGKLRSELAHVTRMTSLGALTASIAHEVNQPLSGIITNASTCLRMLAADPPNIDGARETVRRTIRDGDRAADVIARLRALFAKTATTTDAVDLNEATREVIALSSSDLQKSGVTLRAELAEDLPSVTGDRVQLQQVILNLLLNAKDSMLAVDDRPRHLLIRTERDAGDRVRLTVRDAGVGLSQDGADKVFDAFYTTKRTGMGIGLSVSRTIIESHHGRLWAAQNDGPGSTFYFSIPRGVTSASIC